MAEEQNREKYFIARVNLLLQLNEQLQDTIANISVENQELKNKLDSDSQEA